MKKFRIPKVALPRLGIALALALAMSPAVAGFHASIVQKTVSGGGLKQSAIEDMPRVREVRRSYWRAVNVYKRLLQEGAENIAPPEMNDTASIEFYLNLENGGSLKSAAPEDIPEISDARAQYNALLETDRELIDGYVAMGLCPRMLQRNQSAGIYEICVALLAERKANSRPQVDLSVLERQSIRSLNGTPLQTLRLRLEQLDKSLSAPRTHKLIGRPRLNYDSLRGE